MDLTEIDIKVSISDYRLQEYQALRAEKLYRYDYANRMVSLLLTTTLTIWTFDFALFGINLADYVGDAEISASVRCSLELAQAIIFLVPGWLSVTFFHNSLRNNIRINLISDYLREQFNRLFSAEKEPSWEGMKETGPLFYFNPIGSSPRKNPLNRIGELQDLHGFIFYVSVAISSIMVVSIAFNCMPECSPELFFNDFPTETNEIKEHFSPYSPFIYFVGFFVIIILARGMKSFQYCYNKDHPQSNGNNIRFVPVLIVFILAAFIIYRSNIGNTVLSLFRLYCLSVSKESMPAKRTAISAYLFSWLLFLLLSALLFFFSYWSPDFRHEIIIANQQIKDNRDIVTEYFNPTSVNSSFRTQL